ncbi:GGDEF domain-containing protein [Rossellomorea marisflavi]|uniref:GGDEF domain-containing protein n=1 Tax=Rossellomorea marisflavi TaxID=189381 RepID=A0A5D4RNZ7_9BACI|nr:GGDEF domain-containing protein [Rossellomorea marisflavi]TYS51526.1 GGDEF domain-containing protein [Rossellomorea marisflavi]
MEIYVNSTIITAVLFIGFLFTLIMVGAYGFTHKRDSTLNRFFLAKCLQITAVSLMVFRGDIPDVLSIWLANIALYAGTSLEVAALVNLQGFLRPKMRLIYIYVTIVGIMGFSILFIFYNTEPIRIAYYSFLTAILLSPVCLVGFRSSSLLMKVVGLLYGVGVIFSIVRGFSSFFIPIQSFTLYNPGVLQLVVLLSFYVLSNLMNLAFLLLMKEKVDRELVILANQDDLTGILNRRAFTRSAEDLVRHNKKGMQHSFLLFDVDHFKQINDTYGHLAGDQVLQDMTTTIQGQLTDKDLFGRYGGDEFAILLVDKGIEASNRFTEQLISSLHSTKSIVPYQVSIGITTFETSTLEELYACCDEALYEAKKAGRNQFKRW